MQQEVEINQDYVHYMSNSDLYISHLSQIQLVSCHSFWEDIPGPPEFIQCR